VNYRALAVLAFTPANSRTVQNHLRVVLPRIFVIPELDAFDYTRFAGEAHDAVSPSWPDPVSNGQLLRGSISEVDNDTVEENGITAHPQLNGVKDTIAARDLDPVMIPSAVNLGIAQEIPNLPTHRETNGARKT
jgi:hypothetical protein